MAAAAAAAIAAAASASAASSTSSASLTTLKKNVDGSSIVHIPPRHYAHVLDSNSNITGLVTGPLTLVMQTHEELVAGPEPFVIVPPGKYCVIADPIDFSSVVYVSQGGSGDGSSAASTSSSSSASSSKAPGSLGRIVTSRVKPMKNFLGQRKVCFHGDPFPLYPGETILEASKPGKGMKAIPIITERRAIHLKAVVDFEDDHPSSLSAANTNSPIQRAAGDEWHLQGPLSYLPRAEVEIVGFIDPIIVYESHAIRLRAKRDCYDSEGNKRVTAEEWLVRRPGAYVLGVDEEFVESIKPFTLTPTKAVHLRALQTFKDFTGRKRNAGEEYLITLADVESFIPEVREQVVKVVDLIVLNHNEYCIILNPVDPKTGRLQLGKRQLRLGVTSFFLYPGEVLELPSGGDASQNTRESNKGIRKGFVLAKDEAIVLSALVDFDDSCTDLDTGTVVITRRKAGERWMVHGPREFIPTLDMVVITHRESIPLDANEGIYVQDIRTGLVRAVMGPKAYMLTATEKLWEKPLTDEIEEMLRCGGGVGDEDVRKTAYFETSASTNGPRDKTRVISFRIPHNTAVQIHDFEKKTSRVLFGPDLALLGPHETFTVLHLSAGKPKRAGALRCIALILGPDFTTDIINVETADHARLMVTLAFNNYFDVDRSDEKAVARMFSVPDFIGFACQHIGSKIRAKVAQTSFDEFHKYSARIIQEAVFQDDNGKSDVLRFESNGLCVTNVDVQSIEPTDQHMRDSLMKSVQMAIEIATRSIEASSKHEADRQEQDARGLLEKQKIMNEIEAEKTTCQLYEIRAFNSAIESTGQATAEAEARAERLGIEGESAIVIAQLKADAMRLEVETELATTKSLREAELKFIAEQNRLELDRRRRLVEIEKRKLSRIVTSISPETLQAIAVAGPEMQVKLLQSLGIKSTLITDGNSPINLFNTAQGLLGVTSHK